MAPITGTCLCGGVNISFDATPDFTILCHCSKCQKATGSAFTLNAIVDDATFKVEGPITKYTSTQSVSGKGTYGFFCPTCGCLMYGLADTLVGKVSVKTGVLDDNQLSKMVPSMEINAEKKASWLDHLHGTVVFQKMPDGPPPSSS